ncbi:MAG: beta-propeller fold lactonase family protein [Pseudomonadota bacterium]
MQSRITKIKAAVLGLVAGLVSASAVQAATFVYVSNADSQEISVLELDRSQGTVKPVETINVGGTVMPLAVSADKRFLYAALRSQPFRVTSFAIDAPTGRLRKLGEAPLADSMANISVDASNRWLFAASYPGHKITVNSIDKQTGAVGAVQQLIPTAPNAHAIQADATGRYVMASSLGGDNLSVWRFDAETGRLTPNEPHLTSNAAKSGARHFVWDKTGRFVYLLNEVDASLYVYAWDGAKGSLRELQRTTTLPAGFAGKPWAADLHLTPDGRYLYASERTSSTISTFKVDPAAGLLQPLGQTATEKTPRGFAIDSTGQFLLAVGQDSHSMSVHPIDGASGALGTPKRLLMGKNPNWVEIVDLP